MFAAYEVGGMLRMTDQCGVFPSDSAPLKTRASAFLAVSVHFAKEW